LHHRRVRIGSVGTRAWIALMLGRDGQDPLFLQIKEAEASVLEGFVGASEFSNHGERVVVGQRLMQASSDIFLGWLHVASGIDGKARDFYGRQLKDWKGSAEIEQMVPKGLSLCGGCAGGRSPELTPAAATASRSQPTSATGRASIARCSSSQTRTPSRTSATTRR
jgi:hypothetical protein